MKVRIQKTDIGPGYVRNPGDIVNVGDDEAMRLIGGGYAVPMPGQPFEHATNPRAANIETRRG